MAEKYRQIHTYTAKFFQNHSIWRIVAVTYFVCVTMNLEVVGSMDSNLIVFGKKKWCSTNIDLSRTFDSVSYKILLTKLESCKITKIATDLIVWNSWPTSVCFAHESLIIMLLTNLRKYCMPMILPASSKPK